MISHYNKTSLKFGVPGILLQCAGFVLRGSPDDPNALGSLLLLVGGGLLIAGLAFYAQAKGRHPAWGLMGFLSIIGLIVLACLEDHATDYEIPTNPQDVPQLRPDWKPPPSREIPTIPFDMGDEPREPPSGPPKPPPMPPPLPPRG